MSDAVVGRDAELAALVRALDRAAQGDLAVALVAGEPGIGTSRLVDALAAEARGRGIRVVWAEARDDQHAPLRLWSPVERALCARGPGPSVTCQRRSGWELLDLLVAGLADAAPVVVALDDLHWADEASVWVLERLPRRLAGHGVLLVGATRGEPGATPLTDVRRQADPVVELEGLDLDAAERLVDALALAGPVDAPTWSSAPAATRCSSASSWRWATGATGCRRPCPTC